MTYKSHQQALNAWALDEFTGHFVNYRKMISPSTETLLPFEDFRLYDKRPSGKRKTGSCCSW